MGRITCSNTGMRPTTTTPSDWTDPAGESSAKGHRRFHTQFGGRYERIPKIGRTRGFDRGYHDAIEPAGSHIGEWLLESGAAEANGKHAAAFACHHTRQPRRRGSPHGKRLLEDPRLASVAAPDLLAGATKYRQPPLRRRPTIGVITLLTARPRRTGRRAFPF